MCWLVGILVASLPLFDPIAQVGFKQLRATDVAFALLCLGMIVSRRLAPVRPRQLWPVACVPLALGIATLFSPDPRRAVPDLLRVGYSLALFVVVAHVPLRDQDRRVIARVWLATASVVFVLGIGGRLAVGLGLPENRFAQANSPDLGSGVVRPTATMDTNALPLYLQLSLPFALFLLGSRPSRNDRRIAWACLGSSAALSPLLLSRGLTGAGVSLTGMAAVSERRLPRLWQWRRWLALGTLGLLVVTAALTWWSIVPIRHDPASGAWRINERPNLYALLQRASARMILAHPIAGVGLGRYGSELAAHTSAQEREHSWPPLPLRTYMDPHSTWLGWTAETGLIGLAAWLALFAWLLRPLLRGTWEGRVAGMAMLGLLLNGLHVEVLHLKFVWVFLALAVGAAWQDGGWSGAPALTDG